MITKSTEAEIRTAELIGDFTPDNKEWHELRTQGITGTDAGTILGVNPYASAYSLWAKKTGRVSGEVAQNARMRLGQLLEAPLLQMFAEQNPDLTIYTGGTYRSKEHPLLIANPDGIAYDANGKLYIIEVKTARQYWDEIPPHYIAQVLHYADVFSADEIRLVALTGGDYREYEIPFEPEMLEAQRSAMYEFWELIQADLEPEWDGSQSTYETVREMAKDVTEESVELGWLGVQLFNANQKYKEAEEELTKLKSATLAQMGEAKYGVTTEGGESVLVCVKRSRNGGKPWLELKG